MDDFTEAIFWYFNSIELSPNSADFAKRAEAYLKVNKFREAENDFTESLQLDANYFYAYWQRALARKELVNIQGALEDVELGLKLKPGNTQMKKLYVEIKTMLEKTIDGRGSNVHIANGACITIQYVTNIIIHGIHIHDCKPTGNTMVRSSPSHFGWRTMADGDGISIFDGSHIWIDHNSLSHCADGLVDAIMGSNAITISNNHFARHNEVMLLGHSDSYERDSQMQVTIAFNHFGAGLIQRMPRCRHGYFHVVNNNDYTHWEMYAIGGSASPTINSQSNRYTAPPSNFAKEVLSAMTNNIRNLIQVNLRSKIDLHIRRLIQSELCTRIFSCQLHYCQGLICNGLIS